jgi:CheY-like chemotaxis protein
MAKILVVDDSTVHRKLASTLLERRIGATGSRAIEWTVSKASHGQEALDMIERDPPDLVLTDLNMPGMNGLELVERIKKAYPALPVILMTGFGSEEIAIQALDQGAASYVPKHKLPKELVDTAENILAMAVDAAETILALAGPQADGRPSAAERKAETTAAGIPPPKPSAPRPLSLEECWLHTESHYRLPNEPNGLSRLVSQLHEKLQRLKLCDANEVVRICVAVREALSNAMVHGNLEISAQLREEDPERYKVLLEERKSQEPYCQRSVHLVVQESRDEVCYRIRDEGPGFDPTTAPPANPENLNQDTGRGLRMIKTFLDEVRHNAQGNEITLVKRRAAK